MLDEIRNVIGADPYSDSSATPLLSQRLSLLQRVQLQIRPLAKPNSPEPPVCAVSRFNVGWITRGNRADAR